VKVCHINRSGPFFWGDTVYKSAPGEMTWTS